MDPSSRAAGLSAAKQALLEELRKGKRSSPAPTIPRRVQEGPLPLSFAQQRLWFIHQIDPTSPAYNIPTALRLRGALDAAVLETCLGEIVRRHESLRTRFVLDRGTPVQIVEAEARVELPIIDLTHLPEAEREDEAKRLAAFEARAPFHLAEGPLLRARLIRLERDDHVFLLAMHHIVADGWSMGILVGEIAALYEAFSHRRPSPLPELPIQYGDFALWQRERLSGERLEQELHFWRNRLAPLPPALQLPTDRTRPPVQTFRGSVEPISIPSDVANAIREISREQGATLFMSLAAAFDALLFQLTGEEDIAIGTGIANRTLAEIEGLIGFFVNALVLRVNCAGDPSFRDLLTRTREVVLDAFAHQDLPFERLVEDVQPARDLSRNPVFQVALALQNAPFEDLELPGLSLESVPSPSNSTRFDLELHLWENDQNGLDGFLFYSTDLFDADTAQRMAAWYATLLGSIAQEPSQSISCLRFATDDELAALSVLGRGPTLPVAARTVVELFEERAALAPHASAIEQGSLCVNYGELDRMAERLAAELRALGAGPELRIAVLADRSVEQVAAVLGVAKTGAAYVPLDPAQPDVRLGTMLDRARVEIVLAPAAQTERVRTLGRRAVTIDGPAALQDAPSRSARRCTNAATLANLSYVVFTSGSTGEPNGVLVDHANLANLVAWHRDAFELTAEDRATLIAGVGFDASVWELWPALVSGARLLIPDESTRLNAAALRDWLLSHRVTIAFVPTPIAELLLALEWPRECALRTLLTGGDRLHAFDAHRLPFRVVNNYGPTEATVVATSGIVDAGASLGTPTIGRPIANTRVHVLDAHLNPVPAGVPGELFVSGDGVARGYAARGDLTAARFLPDPNAPGSRMYRTGDRVRPLADGRLEFLGRVDAQVKIRGHRVELGEIEAALLTSPAVETAAVVAREDGGETRLIAYVVPCRQGRAHTRWQEEHVARWRELYDETYQRTAHEADFSFNITGWMSSYTGEPIAESEMREWRDATVARILALRPRRVLEIGCGTGLLLTQLAPRCERYVATDLSRVSLDFVRRAISNRTAPAHIELLERMADNCEGFHEGEFDTVILNSVVQYFPDVEYLERVLEGAMRVVAAGGRVFVGDVRDARLHRAFATSVAVHRAESQSCDVIRRETERILAREEELLVQPQLFAMLAAREKRGACARALIKHGRADNELTRFRYDAVLEIGTDAADSADAAIDEIAWKGGERWREHLDEAFRAGRSEIVLRGVPNARVAEHVACARFVETAAANATLVDLPQASGEHPDDVTALADAYAYTSVAGLSSQREDLFDIAFVREDVAPWSLAMPAPRVSSLRSLASAPLRVTLAGSLVPALREHLLERLPEAMVPSAFVVLDELPLTPHGKIDRRALPAPLGATHPPEAWVEPRDPIEQAIARTWADVIGLERVCATDHFFELGGHSLLATQVISRLRSALDVEVPLRAVFEHPTVESLATFLRARGECEDVASTARRARLTRAERVGAAPLSLAQQRLWFIDRLEPGAIAYSIPNALRLEGDLDIAALSRALSEIVRRHEALRTRFVEGSDGPMQIIDPPFDVALIAEEIPGASASERETAAHVRVAEEAMRPFDLASGRVLRAKLFRLAPLDHVLCLVAHHISSDGWSMGVIVRELSTLYAAYSSGSESTLAELPIQYVDWALWQRAWLDGDELPRQLGFWRNALEGIAPLALPTDQRRPQHPSYRGAALDITLDAGLVHRIDRIAQAHGATRHMALLAAYSALLARWSGQDDFAVGTPVAGRSHQETEPLVGFFVNTLALRVRLAPRELTYIDLLRHVRETALAAYANQDVPFERIVEELNPQRDTSRNPIFQTLFALHNVPFGELELPGLALRSFPIEPQSAQFDLEMSLFENGDTITGRLHWSTDLFERATMERFAAHFLRLVSAVTEDPNRAVLRADILPSSERTQLLEASLRTKHRFEIEPSLVAIFEAQVDRTPAAPALRHGENEITYAELDAHANRLARLFLARGVARGARIGLCLPRGFDLVTAVLAARKAGAAYVPLDPEYPQARLARMIEDAAVHTIVTTSALAASLPDSDAAMFRIDEDRHALANLEPSRLATRAAPDDLVYVIFTSGSTGIPKGVAMREETLHNLVAWQRERSGVRFGRRTLQYASLSFDVSFQEIFATFAEGGTLVLVGEEERRDSAALWRCLARQKIQRLFLPFVALHALAETAEAGAAELELREVITAGEQLRVTEAIRRLFQRTRATLDNQYGPSETHVVTAERLEGDPSLWPELPAIGRPIDNAHVLVLDDALEPAPYGIPGEIFIGGTALARGYIDRPELTAIRFVPDPHGVARRLYRTGDLGRVLPDSRIEFLGRCDRQAKIRGFRVEPAEVEAAIARLAGVRDVAVEARPGSGGELRLIAWVVGHDSLRGRVATFRSELARMLPDYLVPSAFIEVDALALTASGKVDRAALPDPPPISPGQGSPSNLSPLEEIVASAFEHVLGTSRLGRDAHFFDLGGHSLLATRLVARLRRIASAELPLRAVFENPTVRQLTLALAAALQGMDRAHLDVIPRAARGSRAPVSFQQERLWFLDRLDPGGTGYTMSAALDLHGDLDVAALDLALAELVRRHESLRTRFETEDGGPMQVIDPPGSIHLEPIDVTDAEDVDAELSARIEACALAPCDLSSGLLWRPTLLRLAPERHALIFAMHHIVTDGWSMAVLVRELGDLYDAYVRDGAGAAIALPELPIQYADYAIWQRAWLAGGELSRQLGWWREHLAGVPPLELPTDRPRPPVQSLRGLRTRGEITAALAARIRALARAEGATLHMVLLAAYALVISRWAGQDDFAIGMPVANRTREETEGLIGYFVNTLALRVDLAGGQIDGSSPSVRTLIARLRESALGAYSNQDLPFESLLEALRPPRDLSRSPIFQVWFNLVNVPEEEPRFGPLEVHPLGAEAVESRFDLSLYAFETDERINLDVIASADLFDSWRIEEFLDQFLLVLRQMVDDPGRSLAQCSLVTARARAELPDHRAILSDEWRGAVQDLFAARARMQSQAPAFSDANGTWTYGELEAHANQVASWLRANGVVTGDAVAVYAHRSGPTVWAMLAILKAGAAFVMMDPAHPALRLVQSLRDARARAILLVNEAGDPPAELLECIEELGVPSAVLPRLGELEKHDPFNHFSPEPLAVPVGPHDVACITFTSGSTGKPKGIRGGHGSLSHFQPCLERRFGISSSDRFSMLSGLAHDPLQRDVFTPLLAGAEIRIPSPEMIDPSRLANWVSRERVTVLCLTPGMARMFDGGARGESLDHVRLVFMLGEQLTRRDVQRLRARAPFAAVVNLYGTTETQRASACLVIPPHEPLRAEDGAPLEQENIPAGVGMEDVQLMVRGVGGQPAGLGELGELWIRSPHIALGYLDDALTRERFVGEGAARLYRTGDLGRYLRGGVVAIAGRRDDQVNVRGFRVELGEVEAALAAHFDVRDAVCVVDVEGRLVGYVTPAPGRRPDPRSVRDAARARVPDYMVPAAVVVLEELPRTPNGKLDRPALPPLRWGLAEGDANARVAPRTAEEEIACTLFADVLGIQEVGATDNFFDLGGHSLLAVRLLSRASKALGADVPLRALFEAPTPSGLVRAAAAARRTGRAALPELRRAEDPAKRKLSYAQQRLWFLDRLTPNNAAYNLATALGLSGDLDVDALARALQALEQRHEALRTRFIAAEEGPEQLFEEPRSRVLEIEDLCGMREPRLQAHQRLAEEASAPFDLECGPLWRARLFRVEKSEHILSLVFHHIVTDGWSMDVLVREMAALYEAFREGRDNPLEELVLQYADWAAWQRSWLEGGELSRQLTYWREELRDVDPLDLPTDRPRAARRGLRGASFGFELSSEDTAAISRVASTQSATLFHALLACFQALLAKLAGSPDVVVGTPIANRTLREAEPLVGFFANTLALRTRVTPTLTLGELIALVRDRTLDAHAHQDAPFESVVDKLELERTLSRNPLFDVMFVFQHSGRPVQSTGELTIEPLPVETGATPFDLTLALAESQGRIFGSLIYDADLFEATTVERMADGFAAFVRAAGRDPGARLHDIDLRSPAECALVDVSNATGRVPLVEALLHELIAESAERHSDHVAVTDEEHSLTYAALEFHANRIAHRLRIAGVHPEAGVGLLTRRSAPAIVAMLAIWKSGGALVPLDAAYPRSRIASMLRDAGVRVVLAERGLEHALPDPSPVIVPLDLEALDIEVDEEIGRSTPVQPANAAYVIFTSGSTGEPKGTVVEHRAIATRALSSAEQQELEAGDRALCSLPFTFDASLDDVLPVLLRGATLVIHPDPRGDTAADFIDRCARERVTHTHPSVGMFHEIADELVRTNQPLPESLRRIVTGGETPGASPIAGVLRAGSPGLMITNAYGPTEAVIDATRENFVSPQEIRDPVPIGFPSRSSAVHLLDTHFNPVPIGAIGEICIAGVLARGYARRPAETASSFLPDPFSGVPGARLYRTGDFGRRLADGRLVFLGRRDAQVKLRGFRVELGEIEAALRCVPGIREAIVTLRDEGASKSIASYIVPSQGTTLDVESVRRKLRDRLPEFMVPSTIVVLDTLPKTSSGKVDRQALPAPQRVARVALRVAPGDDLERALAPIWCRTLGLAQPDVEESFFEAGGNSLLAIRFVSSVRRELRIEAPVATLFRAPTIRGLAQILRESASESEDATRRSNAIPPLVRLRSGDGLPPLICFPSAFGGISDFSAMAAELDPRRAVFAIPAIEAAPARDAIAVQDFASACCAAIARAIPKGPAHLLGWSYGGLVAFEAARRLLESGREVGALVLIDVPAPHEIETRFVHDAGTNAPFTVAPDYTLPADADLSDIARWIEGVGQRVEAARTYRASPYSGDAVLIRGTESIAGRAQDVTLGWSRFVEGDLAVEWAPGSHESILHGDGARAVAAIVERYASLAIRSSRSQTADAEEKHHVPRD